MLVSLLFAFAPEAHAAMVVGVATPLKVGVRNTVTVTGAPANASVTFYYGLAQGNTAVPGCPGLSVPSANASVLSTTNANAQGSATAGGVVPANLSGRTARITVVATATCTISNTSLSTFPEVVWADVDQIFANNCTPCHWQNSPPASGGFSLFDETDMVNVPSVDVPNMALVEPFDPANSYMFRKLEGTQAQVGGAGARMPKNAPALGASDMDLIEQWILDGAL